MEQGSPEEKSGEEKELGLFSALRQELVKGDVSLTVVPRSQKNCLAGFLDGSFKVRMKGVPVDNAVNEALVKFLSKGLKTRIIIVSGMTSRKKRIRLA